MWIRTHQTPHIIIIKNRIIREKNRIKLVVYTHCMKHKYTLPFDILPRVTIQNTWIRTHKTVFYIIIKSVSHDKRVYSSVYQIPSDVSIVSLFSILRFYLIFMVTASCLDLHIAIDSECTCMNEILLFNFPIVIFPFI